MQAIFRRFNQMHFPRRPIVLPPSRFAISESKNVSRERKGDINWERGREGTILLLAPMYPLTPEPALTFINEQLLLPLHELTERRDHPRRREDVEGLRRLNLARKELGQSRNLFLRHEGPPLTNRFL